MSSPVWRFACLVFVSLLAGCAGTYATKDGPPPRDFSVAGAPPDMTAGSGGNGGGGGSGGGGSGGSGGGGGGSGGSGGGSSDLAAPAQGGPDMTSTGPPDLMPACLAAIADDGGVAPGLHLAAPGPSHTLYAARFDGNSWSTVATSAGAQVADVAIALTGTPPRPLVVARMSDAQLHGTLYDPCYQTYPALAQIRSDGWTALRPSLLGNDSGADVVFRGGFDDKLYWSRFDGSAWQTIAIDGNLHTDQIPQALYRSGAVHALYNNVKDGQNLYDGTLQTAGGVATALGGSSGFGPVAVTVGSETYVVFTGMNEHVYWYKSSAPATIHDLCDGQSNCFILAEAAPALVLAGDGGLVAIFRGTDHHLYSSSLPSGSSTWSAALPVSGNGETTTLAVALAPGLGAALAEAVYVRAGDGYPRHARLAAGAWQVTTVAPVALTGAAALALSH
jgi:hypothetical protein